MRREAREQKGKEGRPEASPAGSEGRNPTKARGEPLQLLVVHPSAVLLLEIKGGGERNEIGGLRGQLSLNLHRHKGGKEGESLI
jgi:hypothetical protein